MNKPKNTLAIVAIVLSVLAILVSVSSMTGYSITGLQTSGQDLAGNIYYVGGNVGIGTTNPHDKLTVNGSENTAIKVNNGKQKTSIALVTGTETPFIEYNNGLSFRQNLYDNIGNWVGGKDRLIISPDGSIGIGITYPETPGGTLQIKGADGITDVFLNEKTNIGKKGLRFHYRVDSAIPEGGAYIDFLSGRGLTIRGAHVDNPCITEGTNCGSFDALQIIPNPNLGVVTGTASNPKIKIFNLAGIGNAYVCVDDTGTLYRSATAC